MQIVIRHFILEMVTERPCLRQAKATLDGLVVQKYVLHGYGHGAIACSEGRIVWMKAS